MGGELQWQQCDAQGKVPQGEAKDDPYNPSTLISDVHGKRQSYGWGEKEEVITNRLQGKGFLHSLWTVREGGIGTDEKEDNGLVKEKAAGRRGGGEVEVKGWLRTMCRACGVWEGDARERHPEVNNKVRLWGSEQGND